MIDPDTRDRILAAPEAILEDRDLMQALIGANDRSMGGNIVDLRGLAMDRLNQKLDRLEDALAVLERDQMVADEGEEGLISQLTESAKVLQGRLERPEGERFSRGLRGWERTYDIEQVDALCDQLWEYFNEGSQMSVDDVRRSVFKPRRGNLGYREPEVDAFLDRVVSVMVST